MTYNYRKIAKAMLNNADDIVEAIDKYIAKKDDDLKKTLKSEGYASTDETVDAINNLEEEVGNPCGSAEGTSGYAERG